MTRSLERRLQAGLALTAAAGILAAIMAQAPSPLRASPVREIDAPAAKRLMDAGAVFIDVRPREAFDAAHIPGAIAIPLQDLPGAIPTRPTIDRAQPIVVYGSQPSAGYEGTALVSEAGFSGAVHLRGGIASWEAAGLPLDTTAAGLLAQLTAR